MSYLSKQNAWIKKNNIKVGDYVKVIKKAKSYERGWNNTWGAEMSKFVGKKTKIRIIYDDSGIKLDDYYNYPYFVLQPVERSFKKGDTVEWTSQAGGYSKKKTGIVVGIVPKNSILYPNWPFNKQLDTKVLSFKNQMKYCFDNLSFSRTRDHKSYIVAVGNKLYHPLVKNLRKVQ